MKSHHNISIFLFIFLFAFSSISVADDTQSGLRTTLAKPENLPKSAQSISDQDFPYRGILSTVNYVKFSTCLQPIATPNCETMAEAPIDENFEKIKKTFQCVEVNESGCSYLHQSQGLCKITAESFQTSYFYENTKYMVASKSKVVKCHLNPIEETNVQKDYLFGPDFSAWGLIYGAGDSMIQGASQVLDPCFEISCNMAFNKIVGRLNMNPPYSHANEPRVNPID